MKINNSLLAFVCRAHSDREANVFPIVVQWGNHQCQLNVKILEATCAAVRAGCRWPARVLGFQTNKVRSRRPPKNSLLRSRPLEGDNPKTKSNITPSPSPTPPRGT